MDGALAGERPMRVAFEAKRRKPRGDDAGSEPGKPGTANRPEGATRAYVTGIPYDTDPEAASDSLKACMKGVLKVKPGFDASTKAFRGYAHVEFATTEQLDAAVTAGAMGQVTVTGRPVKIDYAKEKEHLRPGTASGRGGRGGGQLRDKKRPRRE